jgi:hypothetical protein
MGRYTWSRLNHLQVGRFAEYFVKKFALYGFQGYTAEVDDRGIDFVVRYESGPFYEVQAKSIRGLNYVFLPKDKFTLDRLAALVLLREEQPPEHFLIKGSAWEMPNALFVSRDYEGKKSKPEWGLNLSAKNFPLLDSYRFDNAFAALQNASGSGPAGRSTGL